MNPAHDANVDNAGRLSSVWWRSLEVLSRLSVVSGSMGLASKAEKCQRHDAHPLHCINNFTLYPSYLTKYQHILSH